MDTRPSLLAMGAVLAVLAATVCGLSESEVERIWLPCMLWLVPDDVVTAPTGPTGSRR